LFQLFLDFVFLFTVFYLLLDVFIDQNGTGTPAVPEDILNLLESHDYVLFADPFHEGPFYHGLRKNRVYDIDRLFGSIKYQIPFDSPKLHEIATWIMKDRIKVKEFNHQKFTEQSMDVIAIKRQYAEKMIEKWTKM
jgi:hypothetical protein